MRVLLDTHIWVWTLTHGAALSETAYTTISRAEEVYVSTASIYEIAQKVRRHVWPNMTRDHLRRMVTVEDSGIALLPAVASVMNEAGFLEWDHRDPFDRMIVATAVVEDLIIVTKDKRILAFSGIESIW